MFTKRIRTGATALFAALVLGASGLSGCATDEEPLEEPFDETQTGPAEEGFDEDFYGGRFEEEGAAGEGVEPFGERYDSGPWGGQNAYGEPRPRDTETGLREGAPNPFDEDY